MDLSKIKGPAPTTANEKFAQLERLKLVPHGFPGQLGPSFNLTVGTGYQLMAPNSEAVLSLGWPEYVDFFPGQSFADLPISSSVGEAPSVRIATQGSPTGDLLIDCSIDPGNSNVKFQFEDSDITTTWHDKAIVTPAAGHVFYGIGPVPLDPSNGVPTWRFIRLQATSDSPSGYWQFFGCELTFST